MGEIMSRIGAVVLFGFLGMSGLCGCSSSSGMPEMPNLGLDSVFGARKVMLSVTSDPPGAEARVAPASSCRTPCTLAFDTPGEFTVDVSRDGYVTQTLPVRVSPPEHRFTLAGAGSLRLEPETLSVELKPQPPATGRGSRRRPG